MHMRWRPPLVSFRLRSASKRSRAAGEPRPRNSGGAHLGGRARGPHRPRARGARTGGAGRTNRQIGEELFISTKTASVHVSNILAKLQVSQSRRGRPRPVDSPLLVRSTVSIARRWRREDHGSRGWQLPLGAVDSWPTSRTRASLNGAEVVLHDLDAGRMQLMEELGNEIAAARNLAMQVCGRSPIGKAALDGRRFRRHRASPSAASTACTTTSRSRSVRHPAADRRQRRAGRHACARCAASRCCSTSRATSRPSLPTPGS